MTNRRIRWWMAAAWAGVIGALASVGPTPGGSLGTVANPSLGSGSRSVVHTVRSASAVTTASIVASVVEPSTVRYRASHRFERWSGVLTPSDVTLAVDPADLSTLAGTVVVMPGAFDSGNPLRDASARRVTFESSTFPTSTFTITSLSAEDGTLPVDSVRTVEVAGTLELHGVTRAVTLPLRLERGGSGVGAAPNRVRVTGMTTLSLEAFDMRAPVLLGVRVDDEVIVEIDVTIELTEAPAAEARATAEPERQPATPSGASSKHL